MVGSIRRVLRLVGVGRGPVLVEIEVAAVIAFVGMVLLGEVSRVQKLARSGMHAGLLVLQLLRGLAVAKFTRGHPGRCTAGAVNRRVLFDSRLAAHAARARECALSNLAVVQARADCARVMALGPHLQLTLGGRAWSLGRLAAVLFVVVGGASQVFFLVQLVLEAVVDDEGRLVDVQVCGCLGRARLPNRVVDQCLVALVVDQTDVLLRDAADTAAVMIVVRRNVDRRGCKPARVLLRTRLLRGGGRSTLVGNSTDVAAMIPLLVLERSATGIGAALLAAHKFLVLIEQALFEVVIGLWVLSLLLLASGRCQRLNMLTYDVALARGDKFAWVAAQFGPSDTLVLDKLVVDGDGIERLVMADFADRLEVVLVQLAAVKVYGAAS